MKILKAESPEALCESNGLTQNIRIDFVPGVKPGDYVIVHAGYAIQKMTENEAFENIRFLKEIEDAL
jgi:hydrogenase expression/formation protein HypC